MRSGLLGLLKYKVSRPTYRKSIPLATAFLRLPIQEHILVHPEAGIVNMYYYVGIRLIRCYWVKWYWPVDKKYHKDNIITIVQSYTVYKPYRVLIVTENLDKGIYQHKNITIRTRIIYDGKNADHIEQIDYTF